MNSFNVTIGQDKKQVFINVYYNNVVTLLERKGY